MKKKKIDDQTVSSGDEKLFNQMTEEELEKVIHGFPIYVRDNTGQGQLEKFIIAEFIKELEFLS